MSRVVVTDRLTIALEILKDASSVEEHIGVRLRHLSLCLPVGFKGQVELLNVLIVGKEVREVSISKNVPRLRIAHVHGNSFTRQCDTLRIVSFSSVNVLCQLLAIDHGEIAEDFTIVRLLLERGFKAVLSCGKVVLFPVDVTKGIPCLSLGRHQLQ